MFIFEICQYCPQNCNYIYIHTRYFLVFFCLCEVLFWATCIELKNKDRINRLLISQFNEIKVFFSSIKPVINTMARHSDFVQYFSEYTFTNGILTFSSDFLMLKIFVMNEARRRGRGAGTGLYELNAPLLLALNHDVKSSLQKCVTRNTLLFKKCFSCQLRTTIERS